MESGRSRTQVLQPRLSDFKLAVLSILSGCLPSIIIITATIYGLFIKCNRLSLKCIFNPPVCSPLVGPPTQCSHANLLVMHFTPILFIVLKHLPWFRKGNNLSRLDRGSRSGQKLICNCLKKRVCIIKRRR